MFYWKKDLLEKAAGIKRFEYSPSGSECKKQTSVAEKQYEGSNSFLRLMKKKNQQELKNKKQQ